MGEILPYGPPYLGGEYTRYRELAEAAVGIASVPILTFVHQTILSKICIRYHMICQGLDQIV